MNELEEDMKKLKKVFRIASGMIILFLVAAIFSVNYLKGE
jgi:uncharacterized phage infection (PIP) family protein YhgE